MGVPRIGPLGILDVARRRVGPGPRRRRGFQCGILIGAELQIDLPQEPFAVRFAVEDQASAIGREIQVEHFDVIRQGRSQVEYALSVFPSLIFLSFLFITYQYRKTRFQ